MIHIENNHKNSTPFLLQATYRPVQREFQKNLIEAKEIEQKLNQ